MATRSVRDHSGGTDPDGMSPLRGLESRPVLPDLPPDTTTADLLRRAAASFPDREAYVHGERRVTYAALERMADGFAATLLDRGVAKGDVICLLLPSSIDFAASYLGALRVGAITSAINLRLGPKERASILERTNPKVIVDIDSELLRDGFDAPPPDPARLPHIEPTDPTCIVWTSGTTGVPKGAVYDHARQAAIAKNMGDLTAPGDRRLVVVPFPHVGYMTRMWDELVNATTLVLVGEPWSAERMLQLMRDEHITVAGGVPTQWSLVLQRPDFAGTDFSGIRLAGFGAASIPPELVRRVRQTVGCPVITRYMSTEAGICTSTRTSDPDDVVANTVGKPAPEVALRIVDREGRRLPDGDVGEIICRSPAMMIGYWQDPELTATVIDRDGFLHTGDLGTLDADGNLHIVGRLKEMYIRGGYNVYPTEVEATLAEHPAIERSAVVGTPNPVLGEIGVAFVVPSAGADHSSLAIDALRAWCRERLTDYKAPDRIVIVDELPVTAMMKIDKQVLTARAAVNTADPSAAKEART